MGSTSSVRKFNSSLDAVVQLEGLDSDSVVASNSSKDGVYIAYRLKDGRVIALVGLVERYRTPNGTETSVKVMDEVWGPYYTGASAKVLKALTSTDDPTANKWREACRERLARAAEVRVKAASFKEGTEVVFTRQITFRGAGTIAVGERARVLKVTRGSMTLSGRFLFRLNTKTAASALALLE